MRRVLLDENLPRQLRRAMPGLEVLTVAEAGWDGIKNGKLLRLAASEYDVFITADRGIPHQQNLQDIPIGIIVLAIGSTKIRDLLPYAPAICESALVIQPGQVVYVPGQ